MKLPNSKIRAAICALSSGGILAGNAVAQDGQEQSSDGFRMLEEIVVTARKREEALGDVPMSVVAQTGEDLFEAGHDNLQDLAGSVSNVYFASDSNTRAQVSVRGIGPDTSGIQGPGVGFFIDGVYQVSTGQLTIPFFDLERVEILKGPQGTLYGRNSLGGVINFVTPKPDGEFNASIGADVGTFDTHGVAAAVGGTLIEDTLYSRVSVQRRQSDGPYVNRVNDSPAYPLDAEQIRARFVWEASENLEFDLTAEHSEINGTSFVYSQIGTQDGALQDLVDNYQGDPDNKSNLDTEQYALVTTYMFDSFDLRSQTTYFEQVWDYAVDGDTGPDALLRVNNPADIDVISQEFRITSTDDGPFQWLAGIEYAKTDIVVDNSSFGPVISRAIERETPPEEGGPLPTGFFTSSAFDIFSEQERELWAAFVDITYTLSDRVELGFGLRYDDVESTQDAITTTTAGPTPFFPGLVIDPVVEVEPKATIEQEEWQPKATITVNWTDTFSQFATISKGFREGGFNTLAAGTPEESWVGDVVWNYETGLRWQDDEGRFKVEGAIFYIDWQDSTGSVILDAASTGVLNLGDARSMGVELAGTFIASESVTISASGAVLDCEYTSVNELDAASVQGIFEGNQCLYSSDWNFSVGTDFVHPLSDSNYDFIASANVVGRGDSTVGLDVAPNPQNTVQDAYYLTNLSVGVKNDIYTVIFFADNVFDERYATASGTVASGDAFGQQSNIAVLGQPETYGLRFRADF